MKKTTYILVFILCFTGTANAQFFKKLGKKIEKAAEKTLEKKVEQKTTKETEKAFDSTFNKKSKRKNGFSGLSKAIPADSYTFDHKIKMQIKSGKDIMDADYFLPKTGNFLSVQIKDEKIEGDFFTVFDIDRETMFSFMENDGQKMKMGVAFKMDEEDIDNTPTFDITATENTKTILGYNCKEYKMTGEDMTATVWITKDVDIRFPSTFYNVKQNKSNNQTWMKDLDGWAMEMTMIDTSKRKSHTIFMKCLSIEESTFKINSNDYNNLGY